MSVIERVREWVATHKHHFYRDENHVGDWYDHDELVPFLATLEAERCVWKETGRGLVVGCSNKLSERYRPIFQNVKTLGNTKYCPDCGELVEVEAKMIKCEECENGFVSIPKSDFTISGPEYLPCKACYGTGEVFGKTEQVDPTVTRGCSRMESEMSVIERINNELVKLAIPRQLIPPDPINYIPWTALTIFLSSLAAERCVWQDTNEYPHKRARRFFLTSCGHSSGTLLYNDWRNSIEKGLIQYCPYCGKQIEVEGEDE